MPNIDLVRRERNTKTYKAGDVIFSDGDAANTMYVLDAGEVEVYKGTRLLETIQAGGFFGEMGLVNDKPRSATATCKTDCTVVVLNQADFYFLVQHVPSFSLEVMQVLAERVRRNTET